MESNFNLKNCEIIDDDLNCLDCSSAGMVQNKKVKNALRQQVKRRRKNTIIASGNSHSSSKSINSSPNAISTDFLSSGIHSHNGNLLTYLFISY